MFTDTLKSFSLPVAAVVMAVGPLAPFASAALVVDQQQTAWDGNGGAYAPAWTSFGQSFTPTATSIDWAEFWLQNDSATNTPISLSLSILSGLGGNDGLQGAVLGTSSAVSIVNKNYGPVHFQLDSPIALTPGNTYVLRVNIITQNQGLLWQQMSGNAYAGGTMLQSGDNYNFYTNADYQFREGTGVPEPAGLAVICAGTLIALRRRRSRSSIL